MNPYLMALRLADKAPQAAQTLEETQELTMVGPFSLRSLITMGLGVLLLIVAFIVSRINKRKPKEEDEFENKRFLKNKFGRF